MLSNFIQKPTGALALLATAIGAPYAAFETETGASLRKSFFGGERFQNQSPQGPDSYSLGALQNGSPQNNGALPGYGSLGPSAAQPVAGQAWPTTGSHNPVAMPSTMPYQPAVHAGAPAAHSGPLMPGVPQLTYGEATITPLGPPVMSHQAMSHQAMPTTQPMASTILPYNIETKRGPADVVPGQTGQLWDYTLGAPTLQQMQRQPTQIGGGEVHDLREVLRFDITPIWLTQRFSRVTTVLSNVQLDGMRVPLITGTRPTDLAGTLTYYFDGRQSLRRVNLQGLTGDPSPVVSLMTQFYRLQPETVLGGQLFTTRWNNRIVNVLHVAPAPIIYSGADHSKFVVFLELNQADDNVGLSPEASQVLQTLMSNQRW
jgi:hypothetical protein